MTTRPDDKFPNGMTVTELKRLIADWPEMDGRGKRTTVWIDVDDGITRMVRSACDRNSGQGDLLLSSSAE